MGCTNIHPFSKAIVIAMFIGLSLLPARLWADSDVTITLDTKSNGAIVPPLFSGLSFETKTLLPDKEGRRLFSPGNTLLIALFKQLGIRSLRIGGNTADNPAVKIPGPEDIDPLFGFARAAGVKVIYTLRLKGSDDPTDAVKIAKYVMDHYGENVECLAVGNEPNVYEKNYEPYRGAVKKFFDAISAPENVPTAMFCGPSTTPGKTEWARQFADDFAPTGKIAFVSQHAYPGGSAKKVTDPAAGRDKLLSSEIYKSYQSMYDVSAVAAIKNKVPYRLEEANSYFNGGAKNVSDTLGAALWALDYMFWWAEHGAAGLNFHTGDSVAAGSTLTPCFYATYWTSPTGYHIKPIGYAIKAFDLGGHGRLVPVSVGSSKSMNITAHCVATDDGGLFVNIINKEHGANAGSVHVSLITGTGATHFQSMFLTTKDHDIAAGDNITLGGASIDDSMSWNGKWSPAAAVEDVGTCTIELPPASAVILKLSR